MVLKLLGIKKANPDDWKNQLAQARRHLWINEFAEAKSLFEQVNNEISKQKEKSNISRETILEIGMQAQIGLWAVRYLKDPQKRDSFPQFLSIPTKNIQNTFLIAKIFFLKKEICSEAMESYCNLLTLNPSLKLAQGIGELLYDVPFSAVSYNLLRIIVQITPENTKLAIKLSKWYLKTGDFGNADKIAKQVLFCNPINIEAHRCIAYIAEVQHEWEIAAEHYKLSKDMLRAAVVLIKLGKITEAAAALADVKVKERNSKTWRYFSGWIAFQQKDYEGASRFWQQIKEKDPEPQEIYNCIAIAREWILFSQLQNLNFTESLKMAVEPSARAALFLRSGIASLLKNNIQVGKEHFKQAAALEKSNFLAATLYFICVAQERQSEETDRNASQQLVQYYGDASLFLWLRGLFLIKTNPGQAYRYFQNAAKKGNLSRHLPQSAVVCSGWLLSAALAKGLKANLSASIVLPDVKNTPARELAFFRSVALTYIAHSIQTDDAINWFGTFSEGQLKLDSTCKEVKSIYFIRQRNWSAAFESLDKADSVFVSKVIKSAIRDSITSGDWQSAARFITHGLEVTPQDKDLLRLKESLYPQFQQWMWSQKQYKDLDLELEKQIRLGGADTRIYHNMAVVYTKLALEKDARSANGSDYVFDLNDQRTNSVYTGILEDQPHNDYWQLAIGYWAVVLSDKDFWKSWASQRSKIYGEEISDAQLQTLINKNIPQMLKEYHFDQVTNGSRYASHHRYYAAIVEREIELSEAVRYLIRTAERNELELASPIRQFVDPLLIKEYGFTETGREVIEKISHLPLSPFEADLLKSAFSPLLDVKALVDAKEYQMALERLRKFLQSRKYGEEKYPFNNLNQDNNLQKEISQEFIRVLGLYSESLIDLEKWDEALGLIQEGRSIRPASIELDQLLVKATIGWANQRVKQENFELAIQKIEDTRKQSKNIGSDLANLLSEIWTDWAYKASQEDDLKLAIERFKQAFKENSGNIRAKKGLVACHYDLAVEKTRAEMFLEAIKLAEIALSYENNPLTLKLLASINQNQALKLQEIKSYYPASPYWDRAFKLASDTFDLETTQENVDFYVEIGCGKVLNLFYRENYAEALSIGEKLYELNFNPDNVGYHVDNLLAGICVNYGAKIFNNGNRYKGRELMFKALEYDPGNQVARQNLAIS